MRKMHRQHRFARYLMFVSLVLLASACVPTTLATETTTLESPTVAATETITETAPVDDLFPLTITDALGQEFTFETPPKLGCDWYGCYETMADLGIALHAAAMTPEMAAAPYYSPVGPPEHLIEDLSNPELWAATDMELFLSRVPDDPYYDTFRQIAPVFFLHHPSYGVSSETGYQAYIANARLLGQLSGQPVAAAAAIAQFETMITNLRALSTPELAEQTVGMLYSDAVYYSIATDNPFCVLLAEVGLGQCMGESTGRSVEYNAEEVLALNPDLIIYMGEGVSYQERTDPVWFELTAVKEGRVFDVIGSRYSCCSMRGLIHSFQEYVSHVIPDAGIPAPGPVETFDPSQSPLVQAAATGASKSPFPVTVIDAIGQEFTFDAAPKIGCQFYGCYETLSDLGVTPQAASAGGSADRGANFYVPGPDPLHVIDDFQNPELWAAAEVDLIVVSAPADPSYDALAQAAPIFHIYYTGDSTLVGHTAFAKNLALLGQVTGQPEAAAAALARFESMANKLRSLATPDTAQQKIALLRSRDTYQLFGPGTAFCTVLVEVGLGECLGEGDFLTDLNAEQLLALNPDWIIYVTNNDSYKDRTDPVWAELSAVKEGRVYDTITNRYGCCSLRALYLPFQEYVHYALPDAGAPAIPSTADYNPADNWLLNP